VIKLEWKHSRGLVKGKEGGKEVKRGKRKALSPKQEGEKKIIKKNK
jgi:hypothetical protein